jgi:hypothetical protein
MILTHFILCCAQPPMVISPASVRLALAIGSSAVRTRPLGDDGWPLLRVAAAPALLRVGPA